MLVVLTLFVVARILGGRGPGHVSRRQARRLARASMRDTARFANRHDTSAVIDTAPTQAGDS
jgi:phosphate transport system permease protein